MTEPLPGITGRCAYSKVKKTTTRLGPRAQAIHSAIRNAGGATLDEYGWLRRADTDAYLEIRGDFLLDQIGGDRDTASKADLPPLLSRMAVEAVEAFEGANITYRAREIEHV